MSVNVIKKAWTQLSITFFIFKISSLLTEIWQSTVNLSYNLKNHQNIFHGNGLKGIVQRKLRSVESGVNQ
jgi:hypothetical protein